MPVHVIHHGQDYFIIITLVIYFIYSAIVSGMPTPQEAGLEKSVFYVWAYNSLHILSGNLSNLARIAMPSLYGKIQADQQPQIGPTNQPAQLTAIQQQQLIQQVQQQTGQASQTSQVEGSKKQ